MRAPTTDNDPWVRRFRPAPGGRFRLVCFPYAGGSAGWFLPFADLLASDTDVVAIQYPGRQNRFREPVVADIGELADRIRAALTGLPPLPTAFLGHSMGAVVAFETARRIEALGGRPPLALFASACRAPSLVQDEGLHLADDDRLVEELGRMGGTEAELLRDEEMLALLLPSLRGDTTAIETYRAGEDAVLDIPVTALVGDQDARVGVADAEAWRHHTRAAFACHVFPGGHFYLAEQAARVAAHVASRLTTG
jgi:surfactin synthase thioesterase subunit